MAAEPSAAREITDPWTHDAELEKLAECPHCCGAFLPPDSRRLECRHCGAVVEVDVMLTTGPPSDPSGYVLGIGCAPEDAYVPRRIFPKER